MPFTMARVSNNGKSSPDEASLEAPPVPRHTGAALAAVLAQYRREPAKKETQDRGSPHKGKQHHVCGSTSMTDPEPSEKDSDPPENEEDLAFDADAMEEDLFKQICGREIVHINPDSAEYTESDGSSMTMETSMVLAGSQHSLSVHRDQLLASHYPHSPTKPLMAPLEEASHDGASLDLDGIDDIENSFPNRSDLSLHRSTAPTTVATNLSSVQAFRQKSIKARSEMQEAIAKALQNMKDQGGLSSDLDIDQMLVQVAVGVVYESLRRDQEQLSASRARRSTVSQEAQDNGEASTNSDTTELTKNTSFVASSNENLLDDGIDLQDDAESSHRDLPRPHSMGDDTASISNVKRKKRVYNQQQQRSPTESHPVHSIPTEPHHHEHHRTSDLPPRHRRANSDDIEWQSAMEPDVIGILKLDQDPDELPPPKLKPFCVVCGLQDPIKSLAFVMVLVVAAAALGFGLGVIGSS